MSFFQLRTLHRPLQLSGFPTVTTQAATSVSGTSATGNGTLVNLGGSAVTATGFVWSSSTTNPTLADSSVSSGSTTVGTFTASITGLSGTTTYYYRAYATNAIGTAYGDMLTFTTGVVVASGIDDWPIFSKKGFWSWRYS